VNEMRGDEADQRLEDHRRDGEQARLPHHHPERLAREQKAEIAEADEALHRFVQRRQMHGIECRIDDEHRDQQDQRQGHEEGDGGLALQEFSRPKARSRAAGHTGRLTGCLTRGALRHIHHDASLCRHGPAWRQGHVRSMTTPENDLSP